MVGGGIGGGGGNSGDGGVGVGGRPRANLPSLYATASGTDANGANGCCVGRAGNCSKSASLRLARPVKLPPGETPIKLRGTGGGDGGGDGPSTLGTRADGASWWRAGRLAIIYNT